MIVDDEDYDLVSKYKWYKATDGYVYTKIPKTTTTLLAHRLILPNIKMIDHANGDKYFNSKTNLREATDSQNQQNRSKILTNKTTSKYKGVSCYKIDSFWRAKIKINGKIIPLGRFALEVEAALAYDIAAKEYFGEFALLNFPSEKET